MTILPLIKILFLFLFIPLLVWQGLVLIALSRAIRISTLYPPIIWVIAAVGNIFLVFIGMLFVFLIR